MFLTDYHTHTRLSFDSQADPGEMVRAAKGAGLAEICFTDHVDFLDTDGKPQGFGGWGPGQVQFEETAPFAAPDLRLVRGVELGEAWEDPAMAAQVLSWPELDFVIGSVHNLSLSDGGTDLYYISFPDEDACHAVLRPYFDLMERLSQMDCFDVLGHVIYPLRYMNGRDGNAVTLDRYLPQLERIFRAVIAKDKGIEVNTCRGETVEEWREVLGVYRDCGGRIVTLGSDAHRPQDVGKGLAQAAALLREYGFGLATYEKRQPKIIPLKEEAI